MVLFSLTFPAYLVQPQLLMLAKMTTSVKPDLTNYLHGKEQTDAFDSRLRNISMQSSNRRKDSALNKHNPIPDLHFLFRLY
jgi:hypothetical protein